MDPACRTKGISALASLRGGKAARPRGRDRSGLRDDRAPRSGPGRVLPLEGARIPLLQPELPREVRRGSGEVPGGARRGSARARGAAPARRSSGPARCTRRSCATRRAPARSAAWRSSRGRVDRGGGREPRADRHDAALLGSAALTAPLLVARDGRTCCRGSDRPAIAARARCVWLELALATPVVLWGGWPFFVRGWRRSLNRSLNMFTLIGLGVARRLPLQRRRGARAGDLPRVLPRCTDGEVGRLLRSGGRRS